MLLSCIHVSLSLSLSLLLPLKATEKKEKKKRKSSGEDKKYILFENYILTLSNIFTYFPLLIQAT